MKIFLLTFFVAAGLTSGAIVGVMMPVAIAVLSFLAVRWVRAFWRLCKTLPGLTSASLWLGKGKYD